MATVWKAIVELKSLIKNSSAKHALVDAATLHRKMKSYGLRREEFRARSAKADAPIFTISPSQSSTHH